MIFFQTEYLLLLEGISFLLEVIARASSTKHWGLSEKHVFESLEQFKRLLHVLCSGYKWSTDVLINVSVLYFILYLMK